MKPHQRQPRAIDRGCRTNCSSNVNKHHLGWEKRHWRTNNILYRLREHPGMVIPMNMYDHRDLHHDMAMTPKPTNEQAENLLSHLGRYDSQAERTDYLDMAVEYMKDLNPRYAGHLLVQRAYILQTPFTQLEREGVERASVEFDQQLSLLTVPQLWSPHES